MEALAEDIEAEVAVDSKVALALKRAWLAWEGTAG